MSREPKLTIPLGKAIMSAGSILGIVLTLLVQPAASWVHAKLEDQENEAAEQKQWRKDHDQWSQNILKELESTATDNFRSLEKEIETVRTNDVQWREYLAHRLDSIENHLNTKLDLILANQGIKKAETGGGATDAEVFQQETR